MDILTYALSLKYTDESIEGTEGVLKGKNCKIKSITKTTDGNEIIFEWTADDGTSKTSKMTVKDGVKGDKGDAGEQGVQGIQGLQGISIIDVEVNDDGHLICTLSNGTEIDAGYISSGGTGGTTNYNDLRNKPKINNIEITGNKTSDDLNLVTKVNNKSLVDDSEIAKLSGFEVVPEAEMKRIIDNMFDGYDVPEINPDDDGFVDDSDIDDMFDDITDDDSVDNSDIDDIF